MSNGEIRVLICGAAGKMGRTLTATLLKQPDMLLVAAVDIDFVGADVGVLAGKTPVRLLISRDLLDVLEKSSPDVLVDFSRPDAAYDNLREALNFGVACVVGTTGIPPDKLEELGKLAKKRNTGIFFAPNFSLGAVLMMDFARRAASHFSWAEIIEKHHESKVDTPSGTAMRTAQLMRENRGENFQRLLSENERIECSRGGQAGGIHIHAVRMPGLLAHQEVIFGGEGETLSIKHDTIDRSCFMPGVLMAIKAVREIKGLHVGLESLVFGKFRSEDKI